MNESRGSIDSRYDDARVQRLEKSVHRYRTSKSKKSLHQQKEEIRLKPLKTKRKRPTVSSATLPLSDGIQRRFANKSSLSQRNSHTADHVILEHEYRASKHTVNDPRLFSVNMLQDPRYLSSGHHGSGPLITKQLSSRPLITKQLSTGHISPRQDIAKYCAFVNLFKSCEENKGFRPPAPLKHSDYISAINLCGDDIMNLPAKTLFNYMNKEISITSCSLNDRQPEPTEKKKPKFYISPPSSPEPDDKDGRLKRFKASFFVLIRPNNVQEEKKKFFKSNFTYNPQFTYDREIDQEQLDKYNRPSQEYLPQALGILHQVLNRYGSYENYEDENAGKPITKHVLWLTIKNYLKKEGFYGNVVVNLSESLISRGSMTITSGRPTLNIRPSAARTHWLDGLLHHEIGTHHIRFHNNRQQPWSSTRTRRKLNMLECNPTEEGLASLHSVIMRKDPSLWRAAMLYYACYQSQHTTFVELFKKLGAFTSDVNDRWDYCMRTKRGRTDTSLPGGFCKDQVYLNGIIPLLRQRHTLDFEALVRLGKIAHEDIRRLRRVGTYVETKLPAFMEDMDAYRGYLDHIVQANQLGPYLKGELPMTSAMSLPGSLPGDEEKGEAEAGKREAKLLVVEKSL